MKVVVAFLLVVLLASLRRPRVPEAPLRGRLLLVLCVVVTLALTSYRFVSS